MYKVNSQLDKKHITMKYIASLIVIIFSFSAFSQTIPCVEVQSILVDACAPSNEEGLNEMVRFKVGPNPLNANDLNVTWATTSNSWDGVCQTNQTAAIVFELNSTIQSCGVLIEPADFILPANSNVLLVSSQSMSPSFNSFVGLSDTLYILFHCGSNTTGNFANYNSSGGLRTLTISFGDSGACEDIVTYDRGNLVTTEGTLGNEDGATVNFSPDGTPEYINFGCVAPFEPLSADWQPPAGICQSSQAIDLNSFVTGVSGGTWSGNGVTGSLFNPAGLSGFIEITYTVELGNCSAELTESIEILTSSNASWTSPGELCASSAPIDLSSFITGDTGGVFSGDGVSGNIFNPSGLSGEIVINYAVGEGDCVSTEQQSITVSDGPDVSWSFPNSIICSESGEINLDQLVTGTPGGTWSGDGVTENIFNPIGLEGDITITYSVIDGDCSASLSNTVSILGTPSAAWDIPDFICATAGDFNLDDLVTGTEGGIWSGDNVTGNIFNSDGSSGTYSITYSVGSTGCFDELTQLLVVIPAASAPAIIGDRRYCEGGELPTLTSSSGANTNWFADADLTNELFTGETFQPANNNVTTFYVTSGAPDCRSNIAEVSLDLEQRIDLEIEAIDTLLCQGESISIDAISEGSIIWSTGSTSSSIMISEAGVYEVTATGFCNSLSDSIAIIDASVFVTLDLSSYSGPATLVLDVNSTSVGGDDCVYLLNGVETTLGGGNTLSLATEGNYELIYECSNSAGCIASASRTIEVLSGEVKLDFPNSFTPNGDGFNDFFVAQTSALAELETTIFNRWGQQIAQYSGVSTVWNGTSASGDAPDGVYFYIAKGVDIFGNDVERNGSVTLLRQ